MDETITNDLTIQVGTINGSGSQSSNLILARSLFAMGIPVGPKNLFPSNIQGLPTWFTVRANGQGYTAQKDQVDYMVCMNPQTWVEDIAKVHPGGALVFRDSLSQAPLESRDDLVLYPVPFNRLAKEHIKHDKLRKLLTNLIYVGVLAELLEIEHDTVMEQIARFFSAKPKAIPLNHQAFEIGVQYAKEHLTKADPYRVERMTGWNEGKILIEGNEAAAIGAVFGGCSVLTWYPITPSSSLCENTIQYMKRLRTDPETGERRYAVVQAEDELAAIGMVIGASWAGARAMTATSGPGISLMGEFAGLAYYAEIPAVVWCVQRVGPSTGLPTRTAQGDVTLCAKLSQGDTRQVCLFPASVAECFEFGGTAFDLAERLQTLVIVLSDLDLGMNLWTSEPFEYTDKPYDRGKVLDAEQLSEVEDWGRYKDVDGDGIGYRTLPGTHHVRAAYFTRGSGHDEYARYTESNTVYVENLDRLARKLDTAARIAPAPILSEGEYGASTIGLIAYGTSDSAMREARDHLAADGVPTRYLRVRAYPFHPDVRKFIDECEEVYLIEQNRDGQMWSLMAEDYPELSTRVRKVLHYDGMPIDARFIVDTIHALRQEKKGSKVHG